MAYGYVSCYWRCAFEVAVHEKKLNKASDLLRCRLCFAIGVGFFCLKRMRPRSVVGVSAAIAIPRWLGAHPRLPFHTKQEEIQRALLLCLICRNQTVYFLWWFFGPVFEYGIFIFFIWIFFFFTERFLEKWPVISLTVCLPGFTLVAPVTDAKKQRGVAWPSG